MISGVFNTVFHGLCASRLRTIVTLLLTAAIAITAAEGVSAQSSGTVSVDDGTLQKKVVQESVRQMARQLVADLLDAQLRQLEENGLTDLDIYSEIRSMRSDLDELVVRHMSEVVALLEKTIDASPEQRPDFFRQAREKSRQVLVRLLVERQKLLRRLRIAEIEARVQRLIAEQTDVRDRTQTLPETAPAERAALAVAALEDQQDVAVLYDEMRTALDEVTGWGGRLAQTAEKARTALQEAGVDRELAAALDAMRAAEYNDAAVAQTNIIAALEELLERIHQAQGLMERSDRNAAKEAVEQLAAKQEALRQRTAAPNVTTDEMDRLTEEQLALRHEIAELAQQLDQARATLSEAAEQAAEAAAELFEGNTEEAVAKQAETAHTLARAAEQLDRAPSSSATPQSDSPEQLTQQVDALEQTEAALQEAKQAQQTASEAAADRPQEAAQHESAIARDLSKLAESPRIPEEVRSAIERASQQAEQASKAMSAEETTERAESARRTEQAIDEAISTTRQAIADRNQRRLAAEIAQAADRAARASTPQERARALEQAKQLARDLAETTARQREQAAETRRAVEDALASRKPAESELERLAHAAAKVFQAAAEQQRALGNERAAAAIEKAADVETAVEETKRAADEAARAEPASPSPATDVSRSESSTAKSPPQTSENAPQSSPSGESQAAEPENARTEVDARPPNSDPSDTSPTESTAEESPSGDAPSSESPNSRDTSPQEHQQAVSEAVAEARRALNETSPVAADLAEAEARSRAAEAALKDGNHPYAETRQIETAGKLAEAAGKLAQEIRNAAAEAQPQLATDEQTARPLGDQAVPVDPEATGSLHAAENAARQGRNTPPSHPQTIADQSRRTTEAMAQAAAALAEREQELAQIASMAERLPELLDKAVAQGRFPEASSASQGEAAPEEPTSGTLPPELAALAAMLQAMSSQPSQSGETSLDPFVAQEAGQPSQPQSPNGPPPQQSPSQQPSTNQAATSQPSQGHSPEGDSRSGDAAQIAVQSGDSSGNSSWIMSLPPETRKAIRAAMEQPAPPGYAERLKRYFQDVER
ncbi:hypothetical protein JCM19992_25820 [Thermostilla marina]